MSPENTKSLNDRFGHIMRPDKSPRHGLNMRGFECGDGWFKLLWNLLEEIENHLTTCDKDFIDQFHVVQVKEKFGTLRFYISGYDENISLLISEAEKKSSHTCEICGNKGKLRGGNWWQTLCQTHFLNQLTDNIMNICVHGKTEEYDVISEFSGNVLRRDIRYKSPDDVREQLINKILPYLKPENDDV